MTINAPVYVFPQQLTEEQQKSVFAYTHLYAKLAATLYALGPLTHNTSQEGSEVVQMNEWLAEIQIRYTKFRDGFESLDPEVARDQSCPIKYMGEIADHGHVMRGRIQALREGSTKFELNAELTAIEAAIKKAESDGLDSDIKWPLFQQTWARRANEFLRDNAHVSRAFSFLTLTGYFVNTTELPALAKRMLTQPSGV